MRLLTDLKAKAAALGRDHLDLASKAEELESAALLTSIVDALDRWDRESLAATTRVRDAMYWAPIYASSGLPQASDRSAAITQIEKAATRCHGIRVKSGESTRIHQRKAR